MKAFCLSLGSLLLAACCAANPLSVDLAGADDYVDILDSVASDPAFSVLGESITIACWFDTDTIAGSDTLWSPSKVIVELRGEGSSAHVPFSVGVSEIEALMIGVTDDYTSGAEKAEGGPGAISANTLYHAVFVIDGDDYAIYLDGDVHASGTFVTATGDRSTGAQTANIQIGVRSRDGGQKDANDWDGTIEDLIIWDVALSAGQAKTLYTTRHASLPYPVVWRGGNPNASATGDSGTGATFPDRSPNNNDGTGVSAVTLTGSHVKTRKQKAM